MSDPVPRPFDRLRDLLRTQLAVESLAVSAEARQYWFGENAAAYAEIDVRRGDDFVVAVVRGTWPDDDFIVGVWHHHAPEVWVVDTVDLTVTRVLRDGTGDVLGTAHTLSSPQLPGVSIPVASLFTSS